MDKTRALRTLCAKIFGRNNLIESDFEDVSVWRIERHFEQDSHGGLLIQFSISYHALGKIMDAKTDDALLELYSDKYKDKWQHSPEDP